ncbi:MAG: CRTAC1 family protein [Phycisphaerales bacterium]
MRAANTTVHAALIICTTSCASGQQLGFTEVTQQAGIDAGYYTIPTSPEPTIMMAGGAVIDANVDGWPDLFVLTGGGAPDRLYINNKDGTFTDRAHEWGVDRVHFGAGASVGDVNNDGLPDIFVSSWDTTPNDADAGANLLYINTPEGRFVNRARESGVKSTSTITDGWSSAFGDYDLDGDLDLFVTGWRPGSDGNRLYRNNGNGHFTDVTLGVFGGNLVGIRGFTPAFADMNGDGYPELLISADFGTSTYFVNNRDGTFTRLRRTEAGITEDCNGMGQVVADLDNDGKLDWFISNIWEDPGGFYHGCGQALYINRGDHTFVDNATLAGVEHGYWGWGTDAVDFDNDGVLDLAQVNGWPSGFWVANPCRLWRGLGNGLFEEIGAQCNFDDPDQGRGIVSLDYDNDGDMDLATFNYNGPVRLYRNDTGVESGYCVRVRLDTSGRPDLAPDGRGSVIELLNQGARQYRYIDGAPTFLATSELVEHFGMGADDEADIIRVTWPDGRVTEVYGHKAGVTHVLRAPATCGFPDQNDDGVPDFGDFDPNLDGVVDIEDLYRAEGSPVDVNADGLIDAQDARCMGAALRSREVSPR